MKKVLFGTFIAAAALVACKNGENTESAKVTALQHWVDSVKGITNPMYTDSAWTAMEGAYNTALNAIDTAKLDEKGKGDLMTAKAAFDGYKTSFVEGIAKMKAEMEAKDTMNNDTTSMANPTAPAPEAAKEMKK